MTQVLDLVRPETEADRCADAGFLSPLLAQFNWYVDARMDERDAMTDRVAPSLVATHLPPQTKTIGPATFSGSALIGQLQWTGGTTGLALTGIDARWNAALLPLVQIDTTHRQVEMVNVAGFYKPHFYLQDDGTIKVGIAWSASSSPVTWLSTALVGENWHNGLSAHDWRITITAAGAVTLYRDGVSIQTDAIGATTFDAAPDATSLVAGPDWYRAAVFSASIRAGVGGSVLYSFIASSFAGWAGDGTGTIDGYVTTAPTRLAYPGDGVYVDGGPGYATNTFRFATSTVFNIGASVDATWVFAFRPIGSENRAFIGRNIDPVSDSGAAGWFIWRASAFGLPYDFNFLLSDGTHDPIFGDLGTMVRDDQIIVVVLDRTAHTLTSYVNGVQVGQTDATGLGAISAAGPLDLGRQVSWIYAAGGINRKLSAPEIAQLPADLDVAA